MHGITLCFVMSVSGAGQNESVFHNSTWSRVYSNNPGLRLSAEIQIALYSIIFLLSVVGNVLVIVTLIQNKRMRTVTNVFLLNLAISDLLLAVFCMPFTLVPVLLRDFIFGGAMCIMIRYLQGNTPYCPRVRTNTENMYFNKTEIQIQIFKLLSINLTKSVLVLMYHDWYLCTHIMLDPFLLVFTASKKKNGELSNDLFYIMIILHFSKLWSLSHINDCIIFCSKLWSLCHIKLAGRTSVLWKGKEYVPKIDFVSTSI